MLTARCTVAVDFFKNNNPRGGEASRHPRPRRNEWRYVDLPLDVAIPALTHMVPCVGGCLFGHGF